VGITQKKIFEERFSQLKQNRSYELIDLKKYEKVLESPLVKPSSPAWSELKEALKDVINMPGYLETRIKALFDEGFGAELLTAAEIARATAYKSRQALFTRSTSKSGGKWDEVTLKVIRKTWEARRNTLDVIEKLGITDAKQTKLILSLAHKLRGRILQFLSMATNKHSGVTNPKGLFFALTYKALKT